MLCTPIGYYTALYLPPNYIMDAKRKRQRRSQLVVVVGLVVLRAAWATSASVELGRDGVGDVRQLLLLLLEVFGVGGGGVLFEPVGGLLDSFEDLFTY